MALLFDHTFYCSSKISSSDVQFLLCMSRIILSPCMTLFCSSSYLSFFSFSSRLVWMVLLSHFMTSHPTPFLFCFNDHYFLNLYRISQLEPELIQTKYIAHFSLLSFFSDSTFHFSNCLTKKNYKCVNVLCVRETLILTCFWTSQRTDNIVADWFLNLDLIIEMSVRNMSGGHYGYLVFSTWQEGMCHEIRILFNWTLDWYAFPEKSFFFNITSQN